MRPPPPNLLLGAVLARARLRLRASLRAAACAARWGWSSLTRRPHFECRIRPLRVVSGFRKRSFYSDSRHPRSEAVDFSIPGVPNAVLRQYLLLLEDVGVGA